MAYDSGQTVRIPVLVSDADGNPINATMSIVVTRPDDSVFPAPGIVNDGVGKYHADVTTDQSLYGVWQWKYTATGAVSPAVYTGQFFVRAPGPRIVSLKEAKNYLNKDMVRVKDDEELRDFVDMTRILIENIKGAVVPRDVTEYHDGGCDVFTLNVGPVLSVTTVQENWGPGDVRTLTAEPDLAVGAVSNQYMLDKRRRQIYRRESGYPSTFPYGTNVVKVLYKVGQNPMADNVRLAALELIAHMWRSSQLASGGARPQANTVGQQDQSILMSYGVPTRVRELLGSRKAPRIGRGS